MPAVFKVESETDALTSTKSNKRPGRFIELPGQPGVYKFQFEPETDAMTGAKSHSSA